MTRLLGVAAALLWVLTACSSPEPAPAPATPTTATTTSPTAEPTTDPPPPPRWPLTGATVEDPSRLDTSPVIGVKVENSGPARPWVGLSAADVVFVEMVEAGLTRFHAVYHSRVPEIVEPVRSLRPMDAAILGQWDGTLLASGGQPAFITRVESVVGLRTHDRGDPGFSRDSARRAPHNVLVRMGEIVPTLPASGPVRPLAEYAETPSTSDGAAGSVIRVTYPGARSAWEYSPDVGTYLRSDGGTPSLEADGTRISSRNVLVLDVTTRDTGLFDSVGNPVPETVLTGSGTLHLFSGGRLVPGTWAKSGDEEPFVLLDDAGAPLVLAPGTTWVELLPERGEATWE